MNDMDDVDDLLHFMTLDGEYEAASQPLPL